jgi:Heterokaryon incompatibility protein (HET)
MGAASLYQPLDPTSHEIRLLRILPQQNDTKTLDCLLETVSLETSPKYFGLSYEWGKYAPEQPHPKVLVNSQEIPVKANLALAISRLRELGNDERYWIDALCINQEDDIERAQQVRIMTRIYENSSGVYSWLGLEDGKSDKAADFVQEFHQTFPVRPSRTNTVAREMLNWIRPKLSDPSYQEHWEGLHELCERTYWRRVWVIQEIVVTEKRQGVHLLCGSKEMLLWSFHKLVFLAGQVTFSAPYGSYLEPWWAISRQLRSTSMVISAIIRHADVWGEQQLDEYSLGLLRLLGDHAHAQCTDQRDNVYALLGASLPYAGLELEINYTIPVSQVFLNAAQYIIRGSKSLRILLHYGEHSSELSNLPSWVPDCRY